MITSVTSATATATSADAGWGIALGAGGALLVIGLLISLELLGDAPHGWQRTLRQTLKIMTAPLVFVFAISVLAKALTTLG